MKELELFLRGLLDGEYTSLYISFNDHSSNYDTATDAVNDYDDSDDWVSSEEKQKALANNTVWKLQWYPNTPVGFCTKRASSLEALLAGLGFHK